MAPLPRHWNLATIVVWDRVFPSGKAKPERITVLLKKSQRRFGVHLLQLGIDWFDQEAPHPTLSCRLVVGPVIQSTARSRLLCKRGGLRLARHNQDRLVRDGRVSAVLTKASYGSPTAMQTQFACALLLARSAFWLQMDEVLFFHSRITATNSVPMFTFYRLASVRGTIGVV